MSITLRAGFQSAKPCSLFSHSEDAPTEAIQHPRDTVLSPVSCSCWPGSPDRWHPSWERTQWRWGCGRQGMAPHRGQILPTHSQVQHTASWACAERELLGKHILGSWDRDFGDGEVQMPGLPVIPCVSGTQQEPGEKQSRVRLSWQAGRKQ